jgi:dihydrofolate reductase
VLQEPTRRMRISLIAAMAENRVIGRHGTIPWKVPGEQRMFKRITLGHALIMGRKTHEDIGRPLPGRVNIVVSRTPGYRAEGCLTAASLGGALALCPAGETEAFIIGGEELFRQGLAIADRIYLTEIPVRVTGDTFFPDLPAGAFALTSSEPVISPQPFTLHIFDRVRDADTEGVVAHGAR